MPEDITSESDKEVKLPVGMSLVGKYWDEGKLLGGAAAYEANMDWKTQYLAH